MTTISINLPYVPLSTTRTRKIRFANDDWLRWLTAEESVELLYLVSCYLPVRCKNQQSSRIQTLRNRAVHRRKANNPEFAIYQGAMS